MKLHQVVQAMLAENPAFKFVAVQFETSTKEYFYKTTLDLQEKDKVIVKTPSGMQIVTVYRIVDIDQVDLAAFDYSWVVQKLDMQHCNSNIEAEDKLKTFVRQKQRSALAKQAVEAFMQGSTEEDKETVKALVRL